MKKFEVFKVVSEEDFIACQKLTETVFSGELNRPLHGVIKEWQDVIACKDLNNNEIVGCISYHNANLQEKDTYFESFGLAQFSEEQLNKTRISDLTAIRKSYRKTAVSYLLTVEAYRTMIKEEFYFLVCTCASELLNYHKKFYFLPYLYPYESIYGGQQHPLISLTHDFTNFDKVTLLKRNFKHLSFRDARESKLYEQLRDDLITKFPLLADSLNKFK